jgi:hypothetical protein
MYSTRFRIRSLMIAVAVIALLCWAGLAWREWYWREHSRKLNHALLQRRSHLAVESGWNTPNVFPSWSMK